MIAKRATLWEEAKNFLDTHTDKDGKMSAEDAATYDKMEADIIELGKNIDRFQRAEDAAKQLAQPTTKPLAAAPMNDAPQAKAGRDSEEYAKAVLDFIRTKGKKVSNIMQEQVNADGGYLVPVEWDSRLIQSLEEENVMRTLGTAITTNGEHRINIVASQPTAYWTAEAGTIQDSDAKIAQVKLDAHKLTILTKVTNELLADNAYNLEAHLLDMFARRIANAEEDAFINGTGTGQPTGLFTTMLDPANAAYVQATAGASIAADDIVDIVYKLARPYRKKAAFLMNDATLGLIRKFKDGNNAYMWQPTYTAGEPDRLVGYPIYTSAYAPTIPTTGANNDPILAFGDFSYYNIGDRGTRTLQVLNELYAGNGMVGFLMAERVDGLLLLPEAIRVLTTQ